MACILKIREHFVSISIVKYISCPSSNPRPIVKAIKDILRNFIVHVSILMYVNKQHFRRILKLILGLAILKAPYLNRGEYLVKVTIKYNPDKMYTYND